MPKTKPITSKAEYYVAMARIESLMDLVRGEEGLDELEQLSHAVEAYEREHFPIRPPSPSEAIAFRLENGTLTVGDLFRIFRMWLIGR